MIAAVIDLGTNTFHLIIADVQKGNVKVIFKTNEPVRLGEGRINENIIIPAAFERGLKTLTAFSKVMTEYNVELVKATATSAVRSAENGAEFVKRVKTDTGIEIQVITGVEEAGYIFKGVQATGVVKETSLIMDIGGGSTEFIICTPDKVLWKQSYNIGAARLMQAYFKSDPLNTADQRLLFSKIETELIELKEACAAHKPTELIGSAGAFESFAVLINKGVEPDDIASLELDLDAYLNLSERLIMSTHEERKAMKELIPLRVDMIVMAALLTNYVIKEIGIRSLFLSTYDLKMGVLYDLASKA
jgi:exopolyphosphatase/guanosine-5'-triphosphate,3'-diphosphate pyrophosphatase